jgi:hypothetical protein
LLVSITTPSAATGMCSGLQKCFLDITEFVFCFSDCCSEIAHVTLHFYAFEISSVSHLFSFPSFISCTLKVPWSHTWQHQKQDYNKQAEILQASLIVTSTMTLQPTPIRCQAGFCSETVTTPATFLPKNLSNILLYIYWFET